MNVVQLLSQLLVVWLVLSLLIGLFYYAPHGSRTSRFATEGQGLDPDQARDHGRLQRRHGTAGNHDGPGGDEGEDVL